MKNNGEELTFRGFVNWSRGQGYKDTPQNRKFLEQVTDCSFMLGLNGMTEAEAEEAYPLIKQAWLDWLTGFRRQRLKRLGF
jgi:hypothetical protein